MREFEGFRGDSRKSEEMRKNAREIEEFDGIRRNSRKFEEIRGNSRKSEEIRGNPRKSEDLVSPGIPGDLRYFRGTTCFYPPCIPQYEVIGAVFLICGRLEQVGPQVDGDPRRAQVF